MYIDRYIHRRRYRYRYNMYRVNPHMHIYSYPLLFYTGVRRGALALGGTGVGRPPAVCGVWLRGVVHPIYIYVHNIIYMIYVIYSSFPTQVLGAVHLHLAAHTPGVFLVFVQFKRLRGQGGGRCISIYLCICTYTTAYFFPSLNRCLGLCTST